MSFVQDEFLGEMTRLLQEVVDTYEGQIVLSKNINPSTRTLALMPSEEDILKRAKEILKLYAVWRSKSARNYIRTALGNTGATQQVITNPSDPDIVSYNEGGPDVDSGVMEMTTPAAGTPM